MSRGTNLARFFCAVPTSEMPEKWSSDGEWFIIWIQWHEIGQIRIRWLAFCRRNFRSLCRFHTRISACFCSWCKGPSRRYSNDSGIETSNIYTFQYLQHTFRGRKIWSLFHCAQCHPHIFTRRGSSCDVCLYPWLFTTHVTLIFLRKHKWRLFQVIRDPWHLKSRHLQLVELRSTGNLQYDIQ
jgi:hypothetical protein